MRPDPVLSGPVRQALVDAEHRAFQTTGLSFEKLMRARSRDEAGEVWLARVDAFVEAMPAGAIVAAETADAAVLRCVGDVGLELRPNAVRGRLADDDSWEFSLSPQAAVFAVSLIGSERWGDAWDDAVAAMADGETPPVHAYGPEIPAGATPEERARQVELAPPGEGYRDFPVWQVDIRGAAYGFGWFTREARAHRAATALGVGMPRLDELFLQMFGDTT